MLKLDISPSCVSSVLGLCFIALLGLSACTSSAKQDGKPLPDMTFEHIEQLSLDVAEVNVVNLHEPGKDEHDVSIKFPSAPDVALRRYAENRFKADGTTGIFNFVIEDASVHHSLIKQEEDLARWVKAGEKDKYVVTMDIALVGQDIGAREDLRTGMTLERSISIPRSFSLAEKEAEQFNFLELMMLDVDRAVTKAVREKMGLVLSPQMAPVSPTPAHEYEEGAGRIKVIQATDSSEEITNSETGVALKKLSSESYDGQSIVVEEAQ